MLAQQVLEEDPFSGALFAFRGKRGGLVKILWFDGQGMCLFSKRPKKGHFLWPTTNTGRVSLTPAGLDVVGRHRLAHAAARPATRAGRLMPLLTQDSIGATRSGDSRCSGVHRPHPATLGSSDVAAPAARSPAEIARLQMLIAGLLRYRFGRRSEQLSNEALAKGSRIWSNPSRSRRPRSKRLNLHLVARRQSVTAVRCLIICLGSRS